MDVLEYLEQRRQELDGGPGFTDADREKGAQKLRERHRETSRRWMHRALRVVKRNPGASVTDVREALDCSYGWAQEIVQRLRDADLVRAETGPGANGRGMSFYLYATEEAES